MSLEAASAIDAGEPVPDLKWKDEQRLCNGQRREMTMLDPAEQPSIRQQVIRHVSDVRAKVRPQTTEHIVEAAREAATPDMRAYAEHLGWQKIKHLAEDAGHARFRPGRAVRSGHDNRSGRFERLKETILDTWYSVDGESRKLGELTVAELKAVIEGYERRGREQFAERDRLQRIADAAAARKVSRIKQLGAKRVERLYTEDAVTTHG